MEVEKVRFYSERLLAEGGSVASIGDGLEGGCFGALADLHTRDVDAVGGERLVIWGEIDGGDGELGADAASAGWGGANGEWTAKQGAGRGHVSGKDALAYFAAGREHAAHGACGMRDDGKS